MKKILLLFTILFVSVITTACINNLAIQELNNKAVTYMDKGDAQTAICRLRSSLDLDNEIYQTHYNLAVAYNSIGQYQDAIDEIKIVINLKPDFLDAYYTLAVAKEAYAYELIANKKKVSRDVAAEFNNVAAEAVDIYNEYLVKNPKSKEAELINSKIQELNDKIKEFCQLYDDLNKDVNNKPSKEVE